MPVLKRQRRSKKAVQTVSIADPGHLGFDYQIRYSSRTTVSIQVREGNVCLAAPQSACSGELQQWLESKAGWVRGKLALQHKRQLQIPRRQLQHGESLPLLGRDLRLHIEPLTPGAKAGVIQRGDNLHVQLRRRSQTAPEKQIRTLLEQWYKDRALQILTSKTLQVCDKLGVRHSGLRLRKTKTKWGHCTPAGVIQYNWLILQAPPEVVDYLVVHECCHLLQHNHSPRFWSLVETLLPGYRGPQRWLKQNGHTLTL